jgi:hypothetical protein
VIDPTEYTPAEVEHLGDEEFADLFWGPPRPRVVTPEPAAPRPDQTALITAAVQHVREDVEEVTRHFGVEGRRLVIRKIRQQLSHESKTFS